MLIIADLNSWSPLQILQEITWITLSDLNAALALPATSSYPSQLAWLKLFVHELLPPHIDSLLYMDCDMVALTDLNPLWSTQLEGMWEMLLRMLCQLENQVHLQGRQRQLHSHFQSLFCY